MARFCTDLPAAARPVLTRNATAGLKTERDLETKNAAEALSANGQGHWILALLLELEQRQSQFAACRRLALIVSQEQLLAFRGALAGLVITAGQTRARLLRIVRVGVDSDDYCKEPNNADVSQNGL